MQTETCKYLDKKFQMNYDLNLNKCPSDCSKFFSHKIISKVNSDINKKINTNLESIKSLSNFSLEHHPKNNGNPITNIIDNNNNNYNNKINSNSYQNGFDISPIITNETSFKFIRLTMCKGESNLNLSYNISNSENSDKNKNHKQIMNTSITEYALLKSLNFICENMEVVNLIYYKSKYREIDKILSKSILDSIITIDKPLENIITTKIEENKFIQKIIIDSIEEKDKFISKMVIETVTGNDNIDISEKIEEKYKLLRKQILDNMSEKKRNLMKIIIDTVEEKDKNLSKMIIDMILEKEKPLSRIFINMIVEKDKFYGKKILEILEEKYRPLCEKIVDIIANKDKLLGKTIIDMITAKDKPLGKLIIDIAAFKDNKCYKCKNPMGNHFYYLYDSNFSRIKIDFVSNSDPNLEKIINFIVRKNEDFKKYYLENPNNEKIDYNSDIYFYGYCKLCKGIVTPLIKMPKDLFNYSSAKFFKYIFNNEEICNRTDVKKFNISSLIEEKECNHSSFHDINRIFVTRYGSLKFQFEKLKKYDLISVQNIPDKIHIKNYSKEVNSFECLGIINSIRDNLINELEELKIIENISNTNNITFLNNSNSQYSGLQINIIDLISNLLNSLIDYLKDENNESIHLSSKNIPEINIGNNESEGGNANIKENDSVEKKKKLFKKNFSYENSSEYWEEYNKKDLSKSSDKEKNFINIISNLLKKCEENYKPMGLIKKIFFKIVQIKVLYNKIRSILNIIKILISLELILRDEENKNKSISQIKSNKSNTSNLSFIDKNIKKPINSNETNNIENKDKEEIRTRTNRADSAKSKTPKLAYKIPETIINNHKVENDTKSIFGQLDLQSKEIMSVEQDNSKSNINTQNSNVDNSEKDKEQENCPFEADPKRNFLKSNSENLLNEVKREKIINETKPNLEKNNNIIKEQNINTNEENKNVENKTIEVKVIDNKNVENKNVENINAENKNVENEEKIILSPENLIKLLVDKYATIFDYKENYKNINENKDYSKMLKTIYFYDDLQNEHSSIISETDLSSIVSYAISSSQYKAFIKEKTILLDIKRIQKPKEFSDKILPPLYLMENQKKDINLDKKDSNEESKINFKTEEAKKKEEEFLYNTLLLFDSSNINYTISTADSKASNSSKKSKINRMLEAEILCKDSNHFVINISSLNGKKFECQTNPSRKMTISRQTISNNMTSPVIFSPKQSESEKSYKIIENEIEQIENKISKFYGEINMIKDEIKNINKSNKLEPISKSLNISNNSNFLNNINKDEIFSQINTTNPQNKNLESKKREILSNFMRSLDYSKSVKHENTQEFSKKPNENNINLIEVMGKLYFSEDIFPQSNIEVVIYYPRQFEALRIAYCCTYDDLILSITKSNAWTDVSGGKSKASFYKTNDEKYLFKSINKNEFNMFLEIAFYYFQHVDEYLFHKMPSVLMKILGVYKIKIKKTENNNTTVENYYLMMMENLNYGFNDEQKEIKSYDLKGSTINRYIQKKEKKLKDNTVLLDSNFKKDFNNEPIPLEKDLYGLLLVSVYNDTLFLSKMGIVDYSLLLYIKDTNDKHSLIRVGIIDFIRKYTWDKRLEHFVKTIINGFNSPTIINPNDYKERFISAIKSYFIGI